MMVKPHSQSDAAENPDESSGRFRHLAPADQPDSVHEISEALYQPFMKGGSTGLKFRITGCAINPVPFVQLENGDYRVLDGQVVSSDHARSLGLDQLDQLESPPVVWNSPERRETFLQNLDRIRLQEPLAQAADGRQWIVWCHHFHGTLTADAEASSIQIPFSVWGSRLVKGLDQCPPYHCRLANVDTYQLAVDDEGTITDGRSIATCGESGKKLCNVKLEKCEATGHLVDPAALTLCPVQYHRFLKRLARTCHGCFQVVDPDSMHKEVCSSCRNLQKISSRDFLSDPALSNLVGAHPWLKQARRMQIAHQEQQWLLQLQTNQEGRATWRMLFDRQSGEVQQVSRSVGWLRGWENVPRISWPDFVRKEQPGS